MFNSEHSAKWLSKNALKTSLTSQKREFQD
jgi:hypothetical protein